MKGVKFIACVITVCAISECAHSQNDTSRANNRRVTGYISPGIGICPKGAVTGFAVDLLFSNDWWVSFNYNTSIVRAAKMPDDFEEENINLIVPRDFVNIASIKILKEFSTFSKKLIIGVEGGPSLVLYNYVVFEPNPGYPGEGWNYRKKYLKDRSFDFAGGFSSSVKLRYPTGFGGFEIALFADLNKFESIFGLELYFNFAFLNED